MKPFSSLLCSLVAGGLIVASATSAGAAGLPYVDVSQNAWYTGYIEYCHNRGIMDGTAPDAFSPGAHMTRAVLAEALYRLSGSPPAVAPTGEELPPLPFTDVSPDSPYADAIWWVWQKGYMSGYGAGKFGPDDPVTREQIVAIFWQTRGRPEAAELTSYADQDKISNWAVVPAAWANEAGVMSGKDGNRFDPGGTTTRAEGATILRAYDKAFLLPDLPEGRPVPENPYDSALFSLDERGFLTYAWDGPCHIGIDVSYHQQAIDWTQVAASGVEFAMIRAGYRGYYNPAIVQDSCYTYNMEQALANGLQVGVYFYSQAINVPEAQEEARQLLEWLEGYPITCPVVFDWEIPDSDLARTKDLDGQAVTACALAFCQIIQEAGYTPMIYGSPTKITKGLIDLTRLQDYPFWLAHYTQDQQPTTFPYHYQMWQYTSAGTVPGIEGAVDLNLCLVDWSEWAQRINLG